MAKVLKTTFQLRRGYEAAWEKNNPVLAQGEPGFVIDKNAFKIGDGVTAWNDLEYISGGSWNDLKDKPFGVNETIIFPETLIQGFSDENEDGVFKAGFSADTYPFIDYEGALPGNATFNVLWDGEVYPVTSINGPFIGNRYLYDPIYEDTGEPFYIVRHRQVGEEILTNVPGTSHTIQIALTEVKTIDPKYTESNVFEAIYNETSYNEVLEAYNSGKKIVMVINSNNRYNNKKTYVPLYALGWNDIFKFLYFHNVTNDLAIRTYYKLYIDENDNTVWEVEKESEAITLDMVIQELGHNYMNRIPSESAVTEYVKTQINEVKNSIPNHTWESLPDKPFSREAYTITNETGYFVPVEGRPDIGKISNMVVPRECLVGTEVYLNDQRNAVTQEVFDLWVENGMITDDFALLGEVVLMIYTAGAVIQGLMFSEIGTYSVPAEVLKLSITWEEIKTLDPKYLPDVSETVDTAVTAALTEAKESGEFDGDKGDKGDTGAPGTNGKDGFSIFYSTSPPNSTKDYDKEFMCSDIVDNGRMVQVGDFILAPDGKLYQVKGSHVSFIGCDYLGSTFGVDGKDGTSVTVSSVSQSTASGGTNVVTFSDGKKVNIKNGTNGVNGKDGADGKTPVKGTDYFTAADKTEMVNAVIAALPVYHGEVL